SHPDPGGTGGRFSERLAVSCQIHDGKDRIRPSVRLSPLLTIF
uniref:Uncharacterized protein n=1 Tax=Aegilops tauschii subsp. strangulata TaxID=200361 RepID=A0A453QS98_AEGTS